MNRLCRLTIAAFGSLWIATAPAEEPAPGDGEDLPDLDFLEYLGSWQGSDEEWLIVSEWEDEPVPRADGRPEAEANEDD